MRPPPPLCVSLFYRIFPKLYHDRFIRLPLHKTSSFYLIYHQFPTSPQVLSSFFLFTKLMYSKTHNNNTQYKKKNSLLPHRPINHIDPILCIPFFLFDFTILCLFFYLYLNKKILSFSFFFHQIVWAFSPKAQHNRSDPIRATRSDTPTRGIFEFLEESIYAYSHCNNKHYTNQNKHFQHFQITNQNKHSQHFQITRS